MENTNNPMLAKGFDPSKLVNVSKMFFVNHGDGEGSVVLRFYRDWSENFSDLKFAFANCVDVELPCKISPNATEVSHLIEACGIRIQTLFPVSFFEHGNEQFDIDDRGDTVGYTRLSNRFAAKFSNDSPRVYEIPFGLVVPDYEGGIDVLPINLGVYAKDILLFARRFSMVSTELSSTIVIPMDHDSMNGEPLEVYATMKDDCRSHGNDDLPF